MTDTNDKDKAEEVTTTGKLVQAINSIFLEYLVTDTQEKLGKCCLTVAEELTKSKFGFIISKDASGAFRDLVINDMCWDACRIKDKKGHRGPGSSYPIKGLYGAVLTEGKSLITNSPQNHPASAGLPEGHPVLTAFLGVPLIHEQKTIGMIGLGNREGGYSSEEIRTVEALAPAIVQVLMRKRAEEELYSYREHLEQLVAERTRELRDLAHRLVDAQEKERAAIGSSLHDEIGQFLTYTTLLIDKAARKPDIKILEEAKATVQEAISKIRDLSSMLSPHLLRSAGLIEALVSLIEDFTRRTKVKVDFSYNDGLNTIPEEAALACYRIVQESLTNIIRHAQATAVKVQLNHNQESLHLEIYDNGSGFEPDTMKRATGLTGMRERALALGGEFVIESGPGKGTKVIAIIPLSERKQ